VGPHPPGERILDDAKVCGRRATCALTRGRYGA